ncbi:MAG: RluA family pseudouridine synthase [Bdellovibrionales bacterium]
MPNKPIILTIIHENRLDKALAEAASAQTPELGLSRVRVQQLLKEGAVQIEGQPVKEAKFKVESGVCCHIMVPPPEEAAPQAENIPLSILFEDEDLLVLNKPAGLVVHPAAGHWEGTLVNALLYHCGESLSGIGGVARPGIVHRLDKDTSGLMVVAKNDFSHHGLTAQFTDRTLSRVYTALVWGLPSPLAGEIEGNIGRHPRHRQKMAVLPHGGKEALTDYKVLEVFVGGALSLVSCKLATGRTHQIRVHMAHIGHPVVGDPLYCGRQGRVKVSGKQGVIGIVQEFPRQALHAGEIRFQHPRTHKKMHFTAPLSDDMAALIRACS